jgi:hypothetical protein
MQMARTENDFPVGTMVRVIEFDGTKSEPVKIKHVMTDIPGGRVVEAIKRGSK